MNIKLQRLKGEKFVAYQKRRREGNAAIKRYLGGQILYASAKIVLIPVLGKDLQADLAVINRQYRDVIDVKLTNGEDSRVGRTKGVAFVHAQPKRRHGQGRTRRGAAQL